MASGYCQGSVFYTGTIAGSDGYWGTISSQSRAHTVDGYISICIVGGYWYSVPANTYDAADCAGLGGPSTANTEGGGSPDILTTFCTNKLVKHASDPVNCATGDFYKIYPDISIPGRGIPLQFGHTYNSLAAAQDGPLGFGWSGDYVTAATTDVSGAITVTAGNGSSVTFQPGDTNTYLAPSYVLATLVKNADGTLTYTRKNQEQLTFSMPTTTTAGQLLKVVDRNGYVTQLQYANGRLSTVTDAEGRSLTFSYTGDGHIASVRDPIRRTTVFTYDSDGNLTQVRDVNNGITQFAYYPGTHLIHTITDPRSDTITNTYDSVGRILSVTDPLHHTGTMSYATNSDGSQTTTVTDTNGNITVQQYMHNELLSRTDGVGTPQQATWTYTYDPTSLGVTSVTDPNDHTSLNTWDAEGNQLSHTDALSRTTTYAYDALNDTIAITNPLGVTTVMTYDVHGNLLQTARPLTQTGQTALTTLTYDPNPARAGDVISRTDPDNHTWRYSHDQYGDVTSATDPTGDMTTYTYDTVGRKVSTVSPAGNVAGANPISYTTSYTYNAFDQTIAITDALGHVTAFQYDPNQNLITTTDALGRVTVDGYNADDQRTSVTRPDHTVLRTGYDGDGNVITQTDGLTHTTTFAYDALNRQSAMTDTLGHETTYSYDGAGNRTSVTDPLHRTVIYTYDNADQLTDVMQPNQVTLQTGYDRAGRVISQTDGLGHATTYSYDSLDRRISMTDPLQRTTRYGYDLAGNRTSVTDALSHTTYTFYDGANRTRAIVYVGTSTPNVSFTYNPDGQRQNMTDGTGTTGYNYDALDRVITETNGSGQSVGYGYDWVSNPVTITYPNGKQVIRGYDVLNRMTSVRDWLNHTTRFAYDRNSNLMYQVDPNGTTMASTYDAMNALNRTVDFTSTGPLWAFSYSRNALEQVTGAADSLDPTPHAYGYDNLNQLTVDQRLGATAGWTYDDAHNLTQARGPAAAYTTTLAYDWANQITGIQTVSGTTVMKNLALTYDLDGNRTTQVDRISGRQTSYGYDQASHLITATTGLGPVRYAYNGDGLRMSKSIAGTTETYAWNTIDTVPSILQDGATSYVMGPDGLPIEQIGATGTALYYYHDQEGSTRGLVDGSGHVVAAYRYDAYGNRTVIRGVAVPFGFAGQYTDSETGLQYLRARYYDPSTGQFLSRDPLTDVTGQPYTYASNDPLNQVDPTGLSAVSHPASTVIVQLCDSVSAAYGFADTAQKCFAVSSGGQVALVTVSGVGVGTPSLGVAEELSVTMAPSIESLDGVGVCFGGSVGEGATANADYCYSYDTNTHQYYKTFAGGAGVPVAVPGAPDLEAHAYCVMSSSKLSGMMKDEVDGWKILLRGTSYSNPLLN